MIHPRRKKRIKIAIIIALLFFTFFSVLTTLRSKYGPKHKITSDADQSVQFSVGADKKTHNPLPEKWKFKAGDDKLWADKNFNDSTWNTLPLQIDVSKNSNKSFKGIGWFRCRFKIDSSLINKVFALKFEHLGASEIFLDGKLIGEFGNVSQDPAKEVTERPLWPLLVNIQDTLSHTIAIRYSNHSYLTNYNKYDEKSGGVQVTFIPEATAFYYEIDGIETILFWFIILFAFFITLSIVHLLIYLFYHKLVENLYYSVFVFVFSLLALAPYVYIKTSAPPYWLAFREYSIFIVILFFLSIVACLHSLFRPKLWKRMFVIEVILCIVISIVHFSSLGGIEANLIFVLVLFGIIESVRTVIFGMKKKYPGAAIIGSGVLIFFLFIGILFVDAFVTEHIGFSGDTSIYLITLVFISIISIPLSMSIYLARNFALTNNNLEAKLIEVKELSAKSMEQEKEKQLLLENQNVMLEQQVTERTYEIREQKKIIEEKNKDIIDSINYARRIQAAMLPEESYFKSVFSNSFILYQPRDIVSGDFYYATELNGHKLIIAADCTGHGVPGALMSMVGSNIINKLTHENSIVEPKVVLESLHTQLRQALKQDQKGSANRDGMDVVAVLIKETEIIYAGANRPLIYFDHENQLQEIKATKTPIGGSHIENVIIEQHSIPLNKVKQFFLFSDGFADQFGGPDGKKLMVSKFKSWLSQVIAMPVEEQYSFLLNEFTRWKKDTEQVDDVMVIGVKI
ncbi:MAG: SpoIIE family protein phosphatase [Bacteroidia bacterium]